MLIPISTDIHDRRICFVSPTIILVCSIIFITVWSHDYPLRKDAEKTPPVVFEQVKHLTGTRDYFDCIWNSTPKNLVIPGLTLKLEDTATAAIESIYNSLLNYKKTNSRLQNNTLYGYEGKYDGYSLQDQVNLLHSENAVERSFNEFFENVRNLYKIKLVIKKKTARIDSLITEFKDTNGRYWRTYFHFIPSEKNVLKALYSMFAHLDWFHLIGNMLFLFVCGMAMERYWGAIKFSIVYLLSGFSALLFHVFFGYHVFFDEKWLNTPLIGASGAISGIIGAFLFTFPKNNVRIMYWLIVFGSFKIPVFMFFGFWIIIQFIFTIKESTLQSNVAFSAHIGGFIIGVLFALLMKGKKTKFDIGIDNKIVAEIISEIPEEEKKLFVREEDDCLHGENRNHRLLQGWTFFEKADYDSASKYLFEGIESMFEDKPIDIDLLDEEIREYLKVSDKLIINYARVYKWAKQLSLLKKYIVSAYCFDLSAKSDSEDLYINSLFAASALRFARSFEIEIAILGFNEIISRYPGSTVAAEAQKHLDERFF
jgi:membrane associated rhomboid family serine protease